MAVKKELNEILDELKSQYQATNDVSERAVLENTIDSIRPYDNKIVLRGFPMPGPQIAKIASDPFHISDADFVAKRNAINDSIEQYNSCVVERDNFIRRAVIAANARVVEIISRFGTRAVQGCDGMAFSIFESKPMPKAKKQRGEE